MSQIIDKQFEEGKSIRDISKTGFIPEITNHAFQVILAGSIQRIADATEKTAASFIDLKDRIDYYEHQIKEKNQEIENLKNTNRTLKGHVTRLIKEKKQSTASEKIALEKFNAIMSLQKQTIENLDRQTPEEKKDPSE
jgi:predicted RNase H-like nuclease (RuvC/YqgF family)